MYKRYPAFAGSFYTSDSEMLKKQIEGFIETSRDEPVEIDGKIYGLISPHAGYVYSGQVAAYSYRYLENMTSDVYVVIAPSHRGRFNGASVIPEGEYMTPLGNMKIDSQIASGLMEEDGFDFYSEIHESEHSLEVQVPFLKHLSGDSSIVPVIIGTADREITTRLASSIADRVKASGRSVKIVISTDLSHYHSYDRAVSMDSEFIEAMELFDENRLMDKLASGKSEACGIAALLVGMGACRKLGAEKIKIVKYANSGDVSGDRGQVVGYMAGVIYG